MTKRQTKQQREEQAKALLRQRLDDIFLGATGDHFDEDVGEPWPEAFIAFVCATKKAFCVPASKDGTEKGNEWIWSLWNLSHFRTPETATNFLFDNGIRG